MREFDSELKALLLPLRQMPLSLLSTDDIEFSEIRSELLPFVPLVSIFTAAYNHGRTIEQTIESLAAQCTSFPYEIIIGEDCSCDDTREKVLALQKKYPQKIVALLHEHNYGFHVNFRNGWQVARGKYYAYCEGDDYWSSTDKLQKQVNYLEAHSEVSAVFSAFSVFEESSQKICECQKKYVKEGKTLILQLEDAVDLKGEALATCTACFRKPLLDEYYRISIFAKYNFMLGDLPQRCFFALRGTVAVLPEVLAVYRKNLPGTSASKQKTAAKKFNFCFDSIFIRLNFAKESTANFIPYVNTMLPHLLYDAWRFRVGNRKFYHNFAIALKHFNVKLSRFDSLLLSVSGMPLSGWPIRLIMAFRQRYLTSTETFNEGHTN